MRPMSRAQRAAIGEAMVKAQGTHREPTPAQLTRIKTLKADFGKAVVTVHAVKRDTGHLWVTMMTHAGKSLWVFDENGHYLDRYTQLSLNVEGISDNPERPIALPETDSQ